MIASASRETTLDRINRLADERLALWVKAWQSYLTDKERQRIDAITSELIFL